MAFILFISIIIAVVDVLGFFGFTNTEVEDRILESKDKHSKIEFEKYSGRDAGGIQSNSGELSSKEFRFI